MKQNILPPINDAIIQGIARLVDDSQQAKRIPTHDDITRLIERCELDTADPPKYPPVGKRKRVYTVLLWGFEHKYDKSREFINALVATVRGSGGFREDSPNYVGMDPITNVRELFATEGFILTPSGEILPQVLENLSGRQITQALKSYVNRAQRGSSDAALLLGTGKDLLEATAAHVLTEIRGGYGEYDNFPTLLGQAFVALGIKTPVDNQATRFPHRDKFQKGLYDFALTINSLRNKEGMGHGRPWLPAITGSEAIAATQAMGLVAGYLLQRMEDQKAAEQSIF